MILAGGLSQVPVPNLSAQPKPSRSVWDGVFSDEQSGRGKALYQQHCASCHAGTLDGSEVAPPLAGSEFLANWGGLPLGELVERIRTTMPLTNPGRLSREVNTDIVAYILNVNQFPAGKAALPADAQVLQLIRLDAMKP